ncbi:MAG: hypothetical protein LiPW15_654 [Parcubacteria group bacterium LiPW_15]|nr:MAG: hypothetical protein LiPW15_654 [Parcubacteria group bacterium LiPW_15]
MRKVLSIVLSVASVLYTFPARAAEPSQPTGTKHYLALNTRPVEPGRKVDWSRYCLLRLKYDEFIESAFAGGGTEPGQGSSGYIHKGTALVALKLSADPLLLAPEWIYGCGNPLNQAWDRSIGSWVHPTNWHPEGYPECRDSVDEKPAAAALIDFKKPIEPLTVTDYNREFHLGLKLEDLGPKKLEPVVVIIEREANAPFDGVGNGKKNNTLLYVGIGAAVIVILVIALGSGGGGDKGPSSDPPNGPSPNPGNFIIRF